MEGHRVSRGRGLAPLVGTSMAAVAAGSLVLFSLLAQQTALSPPAGDIIVPRGPQGAPGPPVTVGAPDENPTPGPTERSTLSFVLTGDSSATSAADDPPTTQPDPASLLASVDLSIGIDETVDFEGPRVDVRPGGTHPGGEEPGPDRPSEDACPGRPTKPRAPGEHPHGGPPACGNPHGGPPGQDKRRSSNGPHDSTSPAASSPGNSGSSGSGHPHGSPPGREDHESTPPKTGGGGDGPPGRSSGGGTPPGHSGGDAGAGDTSGNPHGAPPGQTKKESSAGSGSGDSGSPTGNPHKSPPGQAKK